MIFGVFMAKEKGAKKDYSAVEKFCPKCGVRMANHNDRFSCGKCGYTEWKKK